ncbi:MAG TPA: DUF3300 domain-containing protein [Bryobacteraceae bacterium]|nr:DUF3300 domain-containing protein [Bryobacteraceae bacterium]
MKLVALLSVLLIGSMGVYAQDQPPAPAPPPPGETLTPDQLNNLVAPIALYPDPLLSQVLVASTYPLELVQAYQLIQKNPGLTGPDLTAAAQQQNWDPSVQALVVFPDVLKRLNDDITWTTNLGNAFLAQQQDVMDAVQRMRQQAQQAGKLASSPQENVTTTTENGQPYVEIEPVSPDVIYVPLYDPAWIWGPPLFYPYPHWFWPPRTVIFGGLGFGFGGGINVGFFFGAGWHGWGGWGWHPGWGGRTVVVNNTFIHQYNFNTARIANVHGNSVWQHDPVHREGVPYSNAALNNQFRGNVRQNVAPRPQVEAGRNFSNQGQGERFGNRPVPGGATAQGHTAFSGIDNGRQAQAHAEHGYSSMGAARSAPMRSAPAPRAAPSHGGGGRR